MAVDKLERIPFELEVHVRGFQRTAKVTPRKWIKANLYPPQELSNQHPRYTKQHLDPSCRRPVLWTLS